MTSSNAARTNALLVDLYELTMGESYLAEGLEATIATFSLSCRQLPEGWGYLLAAGLEDVLTYLETLSFSEPDLAYLERTGLFSDEFLCYLAQLRFSGDVRALPEGTAFFAEEPVLEISAPVIEAQLVESFVLNQIHFQSLIAGKAARYVDVAGGQTLVDFALRRTHGGEAGLKVARSAYLAGFDSTSNVLAGCAYGIPGAGTMAHSYVECFDDELAAFRAFARSYPDSCTLLIDTYDTLEGAKRATQVGRELAERGSRLRAVRLDSGDLLELSRRVRVVLDRAGLTDVGIFASGGLDEHEIERLVSAQAPITGFGVGSKLGVSADAPFLDMAYKLSEFDGRPVLKLSTGKATWPGRKQVWRVSRGAHVVHDVVGLADEPGPEDGEPLLVEVMAGGRRLWNESLADARKRAAVERDSLPGGVRGLRPRFAYPVRMSESLAALRDAAAATAIAAAAHDVTVC